MQMLGPSGDKTESTAEPSEGLADDFEIADTFGSEDDIPF
jgi:hypothetical protein